MCWTDNMATSQFIKLRNEYDIHTFIETGSFRGVSARLYSFFFHEIMTCDLDPVSVETTSYYNQDRKNVKVFLNDSSYFLRNFIAQYYTDQRDDIVFIFLDAHFYDKTLPKNEKWVIVNELKSLYGFTNCVIAIHDFNCSDLGCCRYDGEPLGFPLVLPHLRRVNPNFYYYINYKEACSIHNKETIKDVKELVIDDNIIDAMSFVNSSDVKKYRGILYCTPTELNLSKYELKRA